MTEYSYWNNSYFYFLNCIDIFSKKLWIFPLKHNSTIECAKAFEIVIKNYSNLKTCHTNNGSKFKEFFDELLKKYKIIHHWEKFILFKNKVKLREQTK
jgi:hypothetical protein